MWHSYHLLHLRNNVSKPPNTKSANVAPTKGHTRGDKEPNTFANCCNTSSIFTVKLIYFSLPVTVNKATGKLIDIATPKTSFINNGKEKNHFKNSINNCTAFVTS
jgi:hypothetical protein